MICSPLKIRMAPKVSCLLWFKRPFLNDRMSGKTQSAPLASNWLSAQDISSTTYHFKLLSHHEFLLFHDATCRSQHSFQTKSSYTRVKISLEDVIIRLIVYSVYIVVGWLNIYCFLMKKVLIELNSRQGDRYTHYKRITHEKAARGTFI